MTILNSFNDELEEINRIKILDNVTLRSGISPRDIEFTEYGTFNYFKVADMNNNEKILRHSELLFSTSLATLIPEGSIIFPKRGASIFTNKIAILDAPSMIDTNLMSMEVKNASPLCIYYFLEHFGLYKIADTSSIHQINNIHFEGFKYPGFKLSRQLSISNLLSQIDNLILNNKRIARLILQYNLLLIDSIFNRSDLESYMLGNLIDLKKGKQLNKLDMVKQGKYKVYNGDKTFSGYTNVANEFNKIIISEGGNSCGFIQKIDDDFWLGGHCYAVLCFSQCNDKYLYYCLKNNEKQIQRLRVDSGLPNYFIRQICAIFYYGLSKKQSEVTFRFLSFNKYILHSIILLTLINEIT